MLWTLSKPQVDSTRHLFLCPSDFIDCHRTQPVRSTATSELPQPANLAVVRARLPKA
ncbi:hypothetical protein COCHEDRAFT_1022281 [Bipolaris maydis C5]|uniref:Uncharacterized protein n=1 Tax=Cochliobolus heterostrophus (strain C5 / ATCC 48332 / race O) TaxID=701091 RepID=M2SY54_COCH5|nr:hypothetical protein COCHEDRAFT_1022281 [Bipolaris maydis C5]